MRKYLLPGPIALLLTLGASAAAAPTMEQDHLPITPEDYLRLRSVFNMTDDDVREFAHTIATLNVFGDHANPKGVARNNKSVTKVFYAVPYFAPSETRTVVGGDAFATYALTVIDAYDELLYALNFDAKLAQQYSTQIRQLERLIEAQRVLLSTANITTERRTTISNTILAYEQMVVNVTAKRAAIIANGEAGASAMDASFLQAMQSELSRIGITPTQQESAQLASASGNARITALNSMRARASNGQLGFRQAIFDAGLSANEKVMVQKYFTLRPDVQVKGLNVAKVYARAGVQTYMDGDVRKALPTVYQIRGINAGVDPGACGNTKTCNVVIEYTESGSRDGKATQLIGTNVLLPVYFEGLIQNLPQPEFDGEVSCHFLTGWQAVGRDDVKDGAIIYDGDVSNKIKYSTVSRPDNGCILTINKGSQDSAEWAALKAIDEQYTRLLFERQQASLRDRDTYRTSVEAEIRRHANQSQQSSRGGWFTDVLGFVAGGHYFMGLATWFIGETRDFYWHTRTEDTSVLDQVDIYKKYSIGPNTTASELRTFDGSVNVCWAEGTQAGVPVMRKCPDLAQPTTETEAANDICPDGTPFETCSDVVDTINGAGGQPSPDPQGDLSNPWG